MIILQKLRFTPEFFSIYPSTLKILIAKFSVLIRFFALLSCKPE